MVVVVALSSIIKTVAVLKVAYLHQGLGVGGIESSLLNLCKHLDRTRVEPTFVMFGKGAPRTLEPLFDGCALKWISVRWRDDGKIHWDENGVRQVVDALKRVDRAVAFYGGKDEAVPLGVYAAQEAGVPLVLRIEWRVAVPPGLAVAAVEVSTPYILRLQLQAGTLYDTHVVGAGVELFPPLEEEKPPKNRTLTIGRMSRLIVEKDPYSFVLAAPKIAAVLGGNNVRFRIAGDGPERETLERLALETGVHIDFVGNLVDRSEVENFLKSLDLFLYSTTCDSFGYVVAEAMASGLPVVATRVCAMEDLIEDGVTGLLVDPTRQGFFTDEIVLGDESAQRHADAVLAVLDRREEMGNAGRRLIERSWSIAKYIDKHTGLLESLPQRTEDRWVVTRIDIVGSGPRVVACAAGALPRCPRLDDACAATLDADQCRDATARRLTSLLLEDDASIVVVDPAVASSEVTDISLDLAFRLMQPTMNDVAVGSKFPLVYASSHHDVEVPWRVCLSALTVKDDDNFQEQVTVCEEENVDRSMIFAPDELYEDDHRRESIRLPYYWTSLDLTTAGSTVYAVVFAVDKVTGDILAATSTDRSVAVLQVMEPRNAGDVPLDVMTKTLDYGDSKLTLADLPGLPWASRRGEARNVAVDGDTLYIFGVGASPPMLGRLRSGAPVGPWRRVRVVQNVSYAEFCRQGRRRRYQDRVFAGRFIQPPPNQYHLLVTFLAALVAQLQVTQKKRPLLLLDDDMGARELFAATDEFRRRAVAQLQAFFDVQLWSEVPTASCFDDLVVGSDERDAIQGFTHATNGLYVPPKITNLPMASQYKRSAAALLGLRHVLRTTFAPSLHFDQVVTGTIRVVIIERRGTRRFRDLNVVTEAVYAGCTQSGRDCVLRSVALEDLSYPEQIHLLGNETDILVGVEGQGLANVFFLRNAAAVVLIVPPGFEPAVVDYAAVTTMLGHDLETSLGDDCAGRRFGFFSNLDYWSPMNDVVDMDPSLIQSAVFRVARRL